MKKLYISLILLLCPLPILADQQLINYFFEAAKIGETEVLTEFLDEGFPVDQRNTQSYTALMMATYYGHEQAVEILLSQGANACLKDKRGHTPLMGAIVKAEWDIAKRLYKEDCKQAHSTGKTLEQFAAVFGQTDKLKALIAKK
ncbi:MAG: ankyrin repeat domain-containing protein [Pseudomonadales bacterium]|nr:ankyrin repeat domain-containing protein [Pseudomonadales bacterium]